jgi:hypothetical protein
MFYACLSDNNVCNGVQSAPSPIIQDNYIDITTEVESGTPTTDFMWRKYENSVWSTDKFEPVADDNNGVTTESRLNAIESAILEIMLG